ncbi:MAG: hypothetical protein U5L45_22425 [Saprospiraceae bacterium]|nr:hypothetical protein [Saprospiraceae bacterium]
MKNALYFVPCVLLLSLTACGVEKNVDDKVQTKDISRDGGNRDGGHD